LLDTDVLIGLLAGEPAVVRLLPGRRVEVLAVEPTELKFVDRRADSVIRALLDGVETIVHLEFQTTHETGVPLRVLEYHAILRARYPELPVVSIVVYLMPDPPSAIPRGVPRTARNWQLDFSYQVFCPWETPITLEQVRASPGLALLASLTTGIDQQALGSLRAAIAERAPRATLGDLLAVTYVIAGRR
jgi:hypothetical protein